MANISDDEGAAATEVSLSSNHEDWIEIQDSLKKGLIEEDDFTWKLPKPKSTSSTKSTPIEEEEERELEELKYVGGVDLSFSKEDPSIACGTLVVLELPGMKVAYHDFSLVRLYVPYVPGFLAFREAPLILELLENVKKKANHFYPQLLMVDGNGVLHPRGFGLACHLGVLTDLPAIGIGKNLHHVDGLTQSGVIQLLKAKESSGEEFVTLMGYSGRTWGVAMRSTKGSSKPIFVSIGHRVSLDTAINIVKMTCKYRLPEPIRQADLTSRQHLRKHKKWALSNSSNLLGILEIKSS